MFSLSAAVPALQSGRADEPCDISRKRLPQPARERVRGLVAEALAREGDVCQRVPYIAFAERAIDRPHGAHRGSGERIVCQGPHEIGADPSLQRGNGTPFRLTSEIVATLTWMLHEQGVLSESFTACIAAQVELSS